MRIIPGLVALLALGCTSVHAEPWSFTDARGVTIALDDVPTRIISSPATTAVLLEHGIRPVGIIGRQQFLDSIPDPDLFDLEGIAVVSEDDNTINYEVLLGLDADLLLTNWTPYRGGLLGSLWNEAADKVEAIVPVAGVKSSDGTLPTLQTLEDVMVSLGADMKAPDVVAINQRFAALEDEIATLAKTRQDIAVAAAVPLEGSFDYMVPNWGALSSLLLAHGVTFAALESEDGFWAPKSYETVADVKADILIVAPSWIDAAGMDNPLVQRLPAIANGQLAVVDFNPSFSKLVLSAEMEKFLALYRVAKHVTQ